MPKSPGEKHVAGTLRVPSAGENNAQRVPPPDPLTSEIEAEIADHLATAAEQFERSGTSPATAQQQARAKFGDPLLVARRCFWIKQGDTVMFRAAVIGLLTLLCLALGVTTFVSLRAQRAAAERLAALAEELRALAELQRVQSTPPAAAEKPLEITGRAFIGTANRYAGFHEIKVCRATDGEVLRRVVTKSDGSFTSGPLPAGDYFLLANEFAKPPRVEIQWGPIQVFPAAPLAPVDLDVSFPAGRLAIETSRPLPTFEINTQGFETGLLVTVLKPRLYSEGWRSAAAMPPKWPIFISRVSLPNARQAASYPQLWFFELLTSERIENNLQETLFAGDEGLIPEGECVVSGELIVRPVYAPWPKPDEKGKVGVPARRYVNPRDRVLETFAWFGPLALRQPDAAESKEYQFCQMYTQHLSQQDQRENPSPPGKGGNPAWTPERMFRLEQAFSRVDRPGAARVPIRAGCVTRIRVEVPDDLESRIQTASDATLADPQNAATAWKENHLLRDAPITVLETIPQSDHENPPL